MTEELKFKLSQLPDSPGCYLMKSKGEIIYVGKAKNLKNRVRQYFQNSRAHTPKVQAMVERVDDFEIVLVDRELEALILECNLIKLHRPWYNILLKDDKHYPYISVDLREPFPRVMLKRRQERDGARYFGPYPGAAIVREVLDVVRMVFPIRTCQKEIRPDPNARPCVHYEIGQCLAPCAGKVTSEEYHKLIGRVLEFLGGKFDPVINELKEKMLAASAQMNYERAGLYRDRIRAVEQVMQKQKAIVAGGGDQDIIATLPEGLDAMVQLMYVRGGKLIGSEHYVMERSGDEPAGEVLTSFMLQHYADQTQVPGTILLSDEPAEPETLGELLGETRGGKVNLHVPQRGEKKQLVDMALKNLRDEAQKRSLKLEKSYRRTLGALEELAQALGLDAPPRRIEGYDISNTQGAQSVGSMVVMLDGIATPKEYRHFRIKTVEGPNDFASMHEVISRRFRHGNEERAAMRGQGPDAPRGAFSDFPDLILIDGGRGQLNEAQRAMHEQGVDIPMFGLAKRIEEIVLPDCEETLLLDRHSEALHLIQRLRDEAHRFGITHHRKLRAKHAIASSLDAIAGVGPQKKKALLKHFRTIESIKQAGVEELCQAEGIGPALAETIHAHFHAAQTQSDTP